MDIIFLFFSLLYYGAHMTCLSLSLHSAVAFTKMSLSFNIITHGHLFRLSCSDHNMHSFTWLPFYFYCFPAYLCC